MADMNPMLLCAERTGAALRVFAVQQGLSAEIGENILVFKE